MVMSRFEVRFSRPDEWLRELALDVEEGIVADNLARIAVTHSQATMSDLQPTLKGKDDRPSWPWFVNRWVEANYVARGQLVKLSGYCGVMCNISEATAHRLGWAALAGDDREARRALWLETNRKAEDRELELSNLLVAGVQAQGVRVRSGNMHGFDPNWTARDVNEISTPAPDKTCATCSQAIYFSNELWRHRQTTSEPYVAALVDDVFGELVTHAGREEAWIETDCPYCHGSRQRQVIGRGGRETTERCSECSMTPGKARRLHHLADPEIADRKV